MATYQPDTKDKFNSFKHCAALALLGEQKAVGCMLLGATCSLYYITPAFKRVQLNMVHYR